MASKYDRIASDLRRKIKTGEIAPGERMETETTLQERYGVSLATLRRALDLLEAEGLIEKRHGIGNFVKVPRRRVRRTTDRYQWEKDRVLLPESGRRKTGATEYDTGLEFNDLAFHAEFNVIEADADLAEVFKVPVGTRLLQRVYWSRERTDSSPFSLSTSYLVYDMISGNPDLLDANCEPWPGGTQHQLYTVGIELDRIIDEVTARPPSQDEAELLGLGPGVSIIGLRKIAIDTHDRVVAVDDVILPGDRTTCVYTTRLARWSK